MASLVGRRLAVDQGLVTLPMAIQMLGVMAGSIPAGVVFSRLGRRPGFWLGAALSAAGSLGFALGVWQGEFVVYCLAAIPAGMGFGISQHLRFAAAEVASAEARPRAIALVMAGGVVAAVLGPEIVKRTNMVLPDHQFLGTYMTLLVLPALCAGLLVFVRVPATERRVALRLPLREIVARPTFGTAVVTGLVAYASMYLVMASTPLQMALCGFGVGASADVIRAHSVAMYLPGFVTGRLIQRFGAHPIILAGTAAIALCALVDIGFNPFFGTFMVGLMLLGLGWNGMFVGATAMLVTARDPAERVQVQATNDFIVFGTVAVTALVSGAIESTAGWAALNLAVVPGLVIAFAMVCWHMAARGGRQPILAE
ncbi:MAG: MFS transporter [Acetobacteraceae bacterium]|nr:MFS transporter [Acetobacteraceae bacterium]